MAQAFQALSVWQVMLAGLLFFGGIYLLFGAATWLLTHHILPALGIGRPLDPRPLAPGQLRRELAQSGVSVLLFGTGMVFPGAAATGLGASGSGRQLAEDHAGDPVPAGLE